MLHHLLKLKLIKKSVKTGIDVIKKVNEKTHLTETFSSHKKEICIGLAGICIGYTLANKKKKKSFRKKINDRKKRLRRKQTMKIIMKIIKSI